MKNLATSSPQADSARKELGTLLRDKRQELHLSLREIENAISVRVQYLQTIEEGHAEQCISPIYVQSFVKQYANHLGLDGEGIIKQYAPYLGETQRQEFEYGIGTLEVRTAANPQMRILPNLLWLLVLGSAIAGAWWVVNYFELI